jgi:uncharacterized repeat protein (TIGR03803 family)
MKTQRTSPWQPGAGNLATGASWGGMLCTVALGVFGSGPNGQAQTYSIMHHFGVLPLTDVTGWRPYSQLVQAPDGTLYGTCSQGDCIVAGTVFKMSPDGSGFTVLEWFTNSVEGAGPCAGLTLSSNVLYGTTSSGGSWNQGTLFKIDLSRIPLNWQTVHNTLILNWTNAAFALQAAPAVTSTYTNIPGATSPFTNSITGAQQFFRLMAN